MPMNYNCRNLLTIHKEEDVLHFFKFFLYRDLWHVLKIIQRDDKKHGKNANLLVAWFIHKITKINYAVYGIFHCFLKSCLKHWEIKKCPLNYQLDEISDLKSFNVKLLVDSTKIIVNRLKMKKKTILQSNQ